MHGSIHKKKNLKQVFKQVFEEIDHLMKRRCRATQLPSNFIINVNVVNNINIQINNHNHIYNNEEAIKANKQAVIDIRNSED